jgi:hypothetical protein
MGASLVWHKAALQYLDSDLQARYGAGASIIFRRGPYLPALQAIASALDVGAVYYSRRWDSSASLYGSWQIFISRFGSTPAPPCMSDVISKFQNLKTILIISKLLLLY